jgi:hypothetical protein
MSWTDRLLPASFNGVAFYVDRAHVEAGQRVAKTLIPNGGHVLESFGPAARAFEVTAYLTGDFAYARAAALTAMPEIAHRGVLVLPDFTIGLVRLTKAKRAFEKDRLGYAAVDLEAVAEPDRAGAALSIGALQSALFAAAAAMIPAMAGYASRALVLAGQPAPVREAAVDAGANAAGDLIALREAARLAPAAQATLAAPFAAMLAGVGDLPADPAGFGSGLASAAIALGDAAEPAGLLSLVIAAGRPAEPAPAAVSSGISTVIAANAGEVVALTAAARALAVGEALARADWLDRAAAIEARSLAAAVFDDALARAGRAGYDLRLALSALKGVATELITAQAAAIAPLITVAAPRRLPALWWAHRLYNNPQRAVELARRTRSPNPAALPERFEALAS